MTLFRVHLADDTKPAIEAASPSAARDIARERFPGVRITKVKQAKGPEVAPAPRFGNGHLWPASTSEEVHDVSD